MKTFFKNRTAFFTAILSLLLMFGCQKESELKTASNVRVHEITTQSLDSSSTTYWYVFFKNGKFIYTKSQTPIEDFSATFFLSSKKIPEELKFAEEFVRMTFTDSNDTWGFSDLEVIELQENDSPTVLPEVLPESSVVDTSLIQISDSTFPIDTFFVDYQVPDTTQGE